MLDRVSHVAHYPHAKQILKAREVQPNKVTESPRLNAAEIKVSWFTPNNYVDGWVYGTTRFQFPWQEIVASKTIYWVEAYRTDTGRTNYRFLISPRRKQLAEFVTPYDPTRDAGPLQYSKGKWYWNENDSYGCEFLVASTVPLELCDKIEFVSHHGRSCRGEFSKCPEKKWSAAAAGAKVIAFMIAEKIEAPPDAFLIGEGYPRRQIPNETEIAVNLLWRALASNLKFIGSLSGIDARRQFREALRFYADGKRTMARETIAQLRSLEEFNSALERYLSKLFGYEFKLRD